MNDLFAEALSNAARGWPVVPLHTIKGDRCSCGRTDCKPGKHPIARLAPNGLKNATCDPATITSWWTRQPDANIAIVTGAISGLVVLDVDPGHGGDDALADLEMIHGKLPQTVEVVTGSGGRHVYFRHPGHTVPNSAGKVGPGLDVRGDGGYVVAPTSLHLSGQCYQWEISSDPADTEVAEIPEWLLQLMTDAPAAKNGQASTAAPSGLPVAKAALDFVANGAPIGQQRERALKAARSYLGAGYSVNDTVAAIWRGLQACPCGDPAHPWTLHDAENIVQDLASRPAPPPAPLSKQLAAASNGRIPTIYASCADLRMVTGQCWTALKQANHPDPKYFRHSGIPSRLEADDQGAPVVRELTPDRLRHELARIAQWKARKEARDGTWLEVDAKPPIDVVKDVLATPDPPLPVLIRIVEVPVFAADGTLQTTPGYHPAARTFYSPAPGLTVPDVPENASNFEVEKARDLIFDMLVDFPFVSDADRAHAVALLLLPFVRDMIDGPTPNHLIEAPTAGCGKGLLADVLLMPAVGSHVGVVTHPKDEDEFRKRLTAQLKEGRAAVLLDNVTQLDSSTLAAALTATTWDDRVLGKTEMLSLSVRCAWVTTANNPTLSTEIARRCVRVRLDPKRDRPWQREGFKHANLRGWVSEHRGDLAVAVLTLARSWIDAGRPAPHIKPLGSYERWTEVIGGILEYAGIPGFLSNLDEFYEAADLEGTIWRQFVAAWWEKHHENQVAVNDLFPLALASEGFDMGKGGERSQRIVFGKRLGQQRDRVIGNFRIAKAGISHKLSTWRLFPIQDLLNSGEKGVCGVCEGMSANPPHTREQNFSIYTRGENIPQPTPHTPTPVESPLPLFNVTGDWQELPNGVMLPNGCEVRVDMTTGKRLVRLDPQLNKQANPFDAAWESTDPDCYNEVDEIFVETEVM